MKTASLKKPATRNRLREISQYINSDLIAGALSGTTGGTLIGSDFGLVGGIIGGIVGGFVTGYSEWKYIHRTAMLKKRKTIL